MMSLTFGLFTQVSSSGPLGPLVFLSPNYKSTLKFCVGVFSGTYYFSIFLFFIHFFFLSLYNMLTIKICVRVLSGTFQLEC